MEVEFAPLPQRLLKTAEAARLLGLSGRTLEKHRTFGTGPEYRKIGGRVVYSVAALEAWADRGARRCTSEATAQRITPIPRRRLGHPGSS